jgi:two-component system sensor histidine kinase HydH
MTNEAAFMESAIPINDLIRQKSVFSIVTLLVLTVLLLLHISFASILGEPSPPVVGLLGLAFAIAIAELIWLNRRGAGLTERAARMQSYVSIASLFLITALLAYFTDRDEIPYFVLLAISILQSAYVCGLRITILIIIAADSMILVWTWHFYTLHPPPRLTEYLEIGMLCVTYILMGLLVWFLVNQLKKNQSKLRRSLVLLEATRQRLVNEEKLAAVGRLASGVAHEIRNPVAMISSSLSTAIFPGTDDDERDEMFAIAARESKRLESLTADFLTYARPSPLRRSPGLVNDVLSYIAAVVKAHATSRSIIVVCELTNDLPFDYDAPQVEGAILNLALNAIDATPDGGLVKLNASLEGDALRIDVEDSGPSISESDLDRIFEPFFTTKPSGTGLGLAIARSAAITHGGDLRLTGNKDGCVRFSMTLKRSNIIEL